MPSIDHPRAFSSALSAAPAQNAPTAGHEKIASLCAAIRSVLAKGNRRGLPGLSVLERLTLIKLAETAQEHHLDAFPEPILVANCDKEALATSLCQSPRALERLLSRLEVGGWLSPFSSGDSASTTEDGEARCFYTFASGLALFSELAALRRSTNGRRLTTCPHCPHCTQMREEFAESSKALEAQVIELFPHRQKSGPVGAENSAQGLKKPLSQRLSRNKAGAVLIDLAFEITNRHCNGKAVARELDQLIQKTSLILNAEATGTDVNRVVATPRSPKPRTAEPARGLNPSPLPSPAKEEEAVTIKDNKERTNIAAPARPREIANPLNAQAMVAERFGVGPRGAVATPPSPPDTSLTSFEGLTLEEAAQMLFSFPDEYIDHPRPMPLAEQRATAKQRTELYVLSYQLFEGRFNIDKACATYTRTNPSREELEGKIAIVKKLSRFRT